MSEVREGEKNYILVNGAYSGMGKETVKNFVNHGFTVFALDKNIGCAEEYIIPLQADITDEESIKSAFEVVRKITPILYAIVHFAGIYMLDSLAEVDEKSFKRAFEINLFGAFCINRTFIPLLTNGSRIVITTSELAPLDPLPFTGIYAVTKSALDRYAYSLCMELQLLGIRVSVLRAGAVDTGMLGVSTDALEKFCTKTKLYSCNAERFKKIVNGVEAKRIMPEKIAGKVLKILTTKNPRFSYGINRNPLLILLNVLPKRIQLSLIKKILK